MNLAKWLTANAEGIVDLLDTLDDHERKHWDTGFAAKHLAWKRKRDKEKRELEGAARRNAR